MAVAVIVAALISGCARGVLEDRVRVAGSETLRSYLSAAGGAFLTENPNAEIRIDLTGTADGLTRMCDGLVEIAAASRRMNDRERRSCAQSGVDPVELAVALDAVAVVTAPESGPSCLTLNQLYAATGPESTGLDDWAAVQSLAQQIDPAVPSLEVADQRTPLRVVALRSGSGTVDTYVSFVIEELADARGNSSELRADVVTSPSSGLTISDSVRGRADLGIIGFADLTNSTTAAKPVAVSVDGACIPPDVRTITGGTYPLQRELLLYIDRADANSNRTAAALVDLVLSDAGQQIAEESGTVRIPNDRLTSVRSSWSDVRP